jgi:uncharacterized protein (DUF58 family)
MVPRHDVALAVAGVLGHLAVRHGDLVGMVHGDGAHQTVIPPRGGAAHAERCLRSAAEAAAGATGPSDLGALLRRVVRSVRRRATLVVVADVVAVDESVLSALRRLSVQHEVMVVLVPGLDPLAPDPDLALAVADVDHGRPVPRWLRDDEALRQELAALVAEDRGRLEDELDRMRLAHVHVSGPDDVVPQVRRLLERHRRDGRR